MIATAPETSLRLLKTDDASARETLSLALGRPAFVRSPGDGISPTLRFSLSPWERGREPVGAWVTVSDIERCRQGGLRSGTRF